MSTEMTKHEQSQPEAVSQEHWLKPPCDVYENDGEWLINADVPGVGSDALTLHLEKSELVIEARRTSWPDERMAFAGYRRAFTLPAGFDGDKVSAELKAGVLAIHLPKSAAMRPRKIAVKAG